MSDSKFDVQKLAEFFNKGKKFSFDDQELFKKIKEEEESP
jgi:hypothetical protein